ncbi:MAG TPA: hypothetical protein VFD53_02445 [Ilumatobacter sp.]|nr:hypothetical protein [Ilumatobacter sp.]
MPAPDVSTAAAVVAVAVAGCSAAAGSSGAATAPPPDPVVASNVALKLMPPTVSVGVIPLRLAHWKLPDAPPPS